MNGSPRINSLASLELGETTLWLHGKDLVITLFLSLCISGPLALEGEYLWTLKDHIDRTWMDGYRNLKKGMGGGISSMLTALTSDNQSLQSVAENIGPDAINLLLHSKMRHVSPPIDFLFYSLVDRCGGCGSKVGSQILERVLKRIKKFVSRRDDIIGGLGVSSGLFFNIIVVS